MEGELLGLLLALRKTRFWTLGCPDLMLFTDLKSLVGLVKMVHLASVPGKMNRIPVALSIYPWAELTALAVLGAEFSLRRRSRRLRSWSEPSRGSQLTAPGLEAG